LLPDPTPDQLIATGFNRCNVSTGEGGSIETEWVYRNALDRTNTAAEAFLGLTAGCAVCHDHKFDPISAEEYYSLYSFFYSADVPALDGNVLHHAPSIKLPTPAQKAKLAEFDRRVREARDSVDKAYVALDYKDPEGSDADVSFKAWLERTSKDKNGEINGLLKAYKDKKIKPEGEVKLRVHYLQQVCTKTSPSFKPLLESLEKVTKERATFDESIPATYVFKEMSKPRDAFVMMRGQYDKPGKKVEPNTPAVLPPLKKADPKARATRLDLARWLVAPENPLTSRVAVNRHWQQIFGTGLVKTGYDLGTQGEPPSHQELLDWLAVDFRENGWDVKRLVRLLVTSAAFKQSSNVSEELLKRDPDNRLYARGPRFRLDAEQVRDNALAVSGLMDFTMGGRGVRPYQPPNIWEPVGFTGSNTRSYTVDKGSSLYRRSVYTFLKRTAPPPFMANFDAPNRELFCARRDRSNTPLQALQLMNDVQHVEAARALATRMMVEGGDALEKRIEYGMKVVLGRPAEDAEKAVLVDQYKGHLARFAKDKNAAVHLIHVGDSTPRAGLNEAELAAFTLVAETLLNLDETVTRN